MTSPQMMMRWLWSALAGLGLTLLVPAGTACAQDTSHVDGYRTPGTRSRTRTEERRYGTGVDEVQPKVLRPRGYMPASAEEARRGLAKLMTARPDRSFESLQAGFEDYRAIQGRLNLLAKSNAFRVTQIGEVLGLPVRRVDLVGTSTDGKPRPRILVLGGVHAGTEKAGMEGAMRFLESAAKDTALRSKFDITVIPLVSPTALILGQRENFKDIDINRRFANGKWTPETKIVGDYVRTQTFDASIDLHTAGDPGRNGFFLINGVKDGGLGQKIMRALRTAALLDSPGAKPSEAAVGPYKLHRVGEVTIPSIEATSMDLLVRNGAKYVYTFEAPTRADPELQVKGTVKVLRSALAHLGKYGKFPARTTKPKPKPKPEAKPEAKKPADPLARYRRPDGTLKWKELRAGRALQEIGGLAHFGMALFLKEVAVVAATGDRARIEEFFDGLLTTDFYKHYGLFVAGARLSEVAYTRYLQRHVRPTFVNGLLKTNLVLAAGIALPMIVEGTFSGKAFAITLSSLGLSSAAVKGGVAGIKWVLDLKKARGSGLLTRLGLKSAGRLARAGGWFYTAAELAVVLYVAEKVEHKANAWLDRRKARADLAQAAEAFLQAVNDPNASPASVAKAADAHHDAWIAYRDFLYGPLHLEEARLALRLQKLAKTAKLKTDERTSALANLRKHPALRRNVERRYGSLEKYSAHLVRKAEQELEKQLATYLASYEQARAKQLDAVYHGNRRQGDLLKGLPSRDWLLGGAKTGAAGDPYGTRGDLFSRLGRDRTRAKLTDAIKSVSTNRLQAYEDERALLKALAAHQRRVGRTDLAKLLDERAAGVDRLHAADKKLISGKGVIDARAKGAGIVDGLKTD